MIGPASFIFLLNEGERPDHTLAALMNCIAATDYAKIAGVDLTEHSITVHFSEVSQYFEYAADKAGLAFLMSRPLVDIPRGEALTLPCKS